MAISCASYDEGDGLREAEEHDLVSCKEKHRINQSGGPWDPPEAMWLDNPRPVNE